jgi:hypothetical protein
MAVLGDFDGFVEPGKGDLLVLSLDEITGRAVKREVQFGQV